MTDRHGNRDQRTRRGHRGGRWAIGAVSLTLALVAASCVPPTPVPLDPVPLPVTEYLVAEDVPGVAFATAADVIGDDAEELIVSQFGLPLTEPGTVTIYERTGGLDEWTPTPVVTEEDGILFPNDITVADLTGNGLADLVIGGGFFLCEFTGGPCGSLQWFEQGPPGEFTRHNVIAPDNRRFYHRAIVTDVDGDGITDLVTVGETSTSARTEWYRGTDLEGEERFESTPRIIGSGGGSLPVVADVNGNGSEDVVSPQFFQPGAAVVWFERLEDPSEANPAGVWQRHTVAGAGLGRGFEVRLVPDLFGDGEARWLGTNHQNTNFDMTAESAVYRFDQGPDLTERWPATAVSTGIQARPTSPNTLAPGLFGTGDLDGDGRTDIVVSGDGDSRLFVLLQNDDQTFTTYVLDDDMGQAGGAVVTDLDGDGRPEALFTSYEQGVVKLYEFGD